MHTMNSFTLPFNSFSQAIDVYQRGGDRPRPHPGWASLAWIRPPPLSPPQLPDLIGEEMTGRIDRQPTQRACFCASMSDGWTGVGMDCPLVDVFTTQDWMLR